MIKFLCFIACLCALPLMADDNTTRGFTGLDWQQMPEPMRAAYVFGYFDGLAHQFPLRHKFVTVGEVRIGLDQFYAADFRNVNVPMSDATHIVMLTAIGEAPEVIRAKLDELRDTNEAPH
jgi:hypothetical protein